MKPQVYVWTSVAALLLLWGGAKAFARSPKVDWTIYGEDLGTKVTVSTWNAEGGQARHVAQKIDVVSSLPVGASFQYDGEGFAFRPRPSGAERKLPTYADGVHKARYVFVWSGEGEPPATVDVWALASCHGAEGTSAEGKVRLIDGGTGAAPLLATGEKPSDDPESGRVLRTVALKVKDGRAELRIEGHLKTGGKGKWSAFVGGGVSARPSCRNVSGPPPS